MEAQLKKIMMIEKRKDLEEEARYFEKYSDIFNLVFTFLRRRKVLLYGGMALNELMPKKYKFYSPKTLPDIDILCLDGKKLAKDCISFFIRHCFNNVSTSTSEALHPGTYKVYVDAVQVLDITDISERAFKRLSKNRVHIEKNGLYIVDPQYLRMTLHLILSKGDAITVHRWGKTLERLVLFYKAFPPKPCNISKQLKKLDLGWLKDEDAIPKGLIHDIRELLKGTEYIMMGLHEMELILNIKVPDNLSVLPFTIFADDEVNRVGKIIVSKLQKHSITTFSKSNTHLDYDPFKLKVTKVFPADDFVSDHVIISYKGTTIVYISNSNICEGFNLYKGVRVASVHTIIRMLLCMMLSSYHHFDEYIESMECIVNILALATNTNRMSGNRKKILHDVVEQCYGATEGLVTMRKNRLLRLNNQ
jgi:hypothetical protein